MELINKLQDYEFLQYLNAGSKFTFPTSSLVKDQQRISGTKRDMRKKFIKSARPTYMNNRIINKAQGGIKLNSYTPQEPEEQETAITPQQFGNTSEFSYLDNIESIEDSFARIYLHKESTPVQYMEESSVNFSGFDVDSAVQYLTEHAKNVSVGQCAKFVREALEHGGLDTTGRPKMAFRYNEFLPKLGFVPIIESNYTGNNLPKDYTPQKGDIVVIGANSRHKAGHIAMFNGQQWISDFKQRTFHGLKGADYDKYIIWRHK